MTFVVVSAIVLALSTLPTEPTSVPVHWTVKLADDSKAGSAETLLVGGVLSMVFSHTGVSIGAFTSKTFRQHNF